MTTYTITAAQYSNAERTAAVITTIEAGAILISQADADIWAQMLAACTPDDMPLPVEAPASPAMDQQQARLTLAAAVGLTEAELNAVLQAAKVD